MTSAVLRLLEELAPALERLVAHEVHKAVYPAVIEAVYPAVIEAIVTRRVHRARDENRARHGGAGGGVMPTFATFEEFDAAWWAEHERTLAALPGELRARGHDQAEIAAVVDLVAVMNPRAHAEMIQKIRIAIAAGA